MEECIFCKILERGLPAHVVYEDADTLAFLDIKPNNPGHTLVIPKIHVENLYSMSDHSLAAVMRTAQKVARAVKAAVDADGINLTMNNEDAAGQVIFHAHLHVIPRFKEDGYRHWPLKAYKEGEAEAIAQKIRSAL